MSRESGPNWQPMPRAPSLEERIREIVNDLCARAGAPRSRALTVFYSLDAGRPPTLQWYNRRDGKATGRAKDRGRSSKRVVVGETWLRQNMPEAFAFTCAVRIQYGLRVITQLTVE